MGDIEKRRAQAKVDFEVSVEKADGARQAEWRKTARLGRGLHLRFMRTDFILARLLGAGKCGPGAKLFEEKKVA